MTEFTPVRLVSPDGVDYVARNPMDLNDRIAEGYKRVRVVPQLPVYAPPSYMHSYDDESE